MFNKEELELAAKVVAEIAGNPEVGPVKDLIDQIKNSAAPAKEVRVLEPKEKR
jgi:hypothetical protein